MTIELDNEAEQSIDIQTEGRRIVLSEQSATGSTRIDMSRREALELAAALIKAAMP
jgi:hypothetical protein